MSLSHRIIVSVFVLVATQATAAYAQATPAGQLPAKAPSDSSRAHPAPPPGAQRHTRVADLAFMAGCWRGVTRSRTTIEEFYTAPSSNLILGVTRYVREGRTVDFEFTRIDQTDSGAVITPHPKGVRSVGFAPKAIESNRAAWENLAHDFPQRIIYTRVAGDTLVARIEGRTPSGERALEWRMARAVC